LNSTLSLELENAKKYLNDLEIAREELIKRSRDIVNICRTIVSKVLIGEEVKDLVENLSYRFRELIEVVKNFPELYYSNTFYSIAGEYVEAIQFYHITYENRVLTLKELGIHPIPYLHGLVEVIGELKRLSLDLVRKDMFEEAYKYLEIAENLYNSLSSLSYPDAILPGFRRKLDIYRKVIDDWKKFLVDMESRRKLIRKLNAILKSS
jgi:translin